MNKMSRKEEIESLKIQVNILEAQVHTIYGTLAAKGVINDKEFQKDSKKMLKYMKGKQN
ncbi:hypothetical protein HZC31_03520 [Candidatus Woesearchaeota archaeon]|nr:hypothetical protein [Candidatus Woesearchaeota archaeon]